jgi:hypothetical protein
VENTTTYHEIDFLLQAQRFNIDFSYITQKGLSFVREFVLRLVHLAPMTKFQIAVFFGFSRKEVEEAVDDLIQRDELTFTENERLTLTDKSRGYFTEIGGSPRLSSLQDSSARLSFDLATFTCLERISQDKWKTGIPIKVSDDNVARSEVHVEKHFQRQFNEIRHKGLLTRSLAQDGKDSPSIYMVKSVDKIGKMPLRLTVKFKIDENGNSIEREDFEVLKSSDDVHEQITAELEHLKRPSNFMAIVQAMSKIGDSDTLKLFDSKTNSVNLQFLDDLKRLEENSQKKTTFLGPIYSQKNWDLLQKQLAPVLVSRIESKADTGQPTFIWVAPSDPYWGKSNRLSTSLDNFIRTASTKDKKLYSPIIYLPLSGSDDHRATKQWEQELAPHTSKCYGLIEGFLGGNVELMLFEGECVVVVYHISLPDAYPVTFPLGFISKDQKTVSAIGKIFKTYVQGNSGFDRPNDCGLLSKLRKK